MEEKGTSVWSQRLEGKNPPFSPEDFMSPFQKAIGRGILSTPEVIPAAAMEMLIGDMLANPGRADSIFNDAQLTVDGIRMQWGYQDKPQPEPEQSPRRPRGAQLRRLQDTPGRIFEEGQHAVPGFAKAVVKALTLKLSHMGSKLGLTPDEICSTSKDEVGEVLAPAEPSVQ